MNKLIHAALLVAVSSSAFAGATVTFVDIGKMTDVPRDYQKRDDMQFLLREHLSLLSEKLPAGQALKVEFLDIDLAGDEFPRVALRDIRVLRGQADWPRIHLRYLIEQDGKVISSGDSKLSDPGYMMGVNRYDRDLYGHEKQMLDDWFRKDVLHQH
ncbi:MULTISPECIES: DUF3016 domain-containing protein [unclassified Duganella]|uniref:DUF3016 domain-containing protein n=1 Tax=unclassified Duganella TaxID=2636909 RepID=UPI000712F6E6|nr:MULTISPECIES: DUF3016 domain-containing protein [unclassified Duganella]KRB87310.1 hypothetical protein ASE26_07975 [Duganella sp. Root198D2]